ncbi:MAG: hypothetical protein JWR68_2676 [Polaromonas sp.]|nr:hypothetical protein [Polaromonas sp.]
MKNGTPAPASRLFLNALARLLTAAVAACLLQFPAQASPLSSGDEQGVRAVVEGQLVALANDDASKAFSFAAPNVRQAVGTAPRFMAMVRASYPALYRPASSAFLKPDGHDDQAIQRVQIVGADGSTWLAIYSLQRQKNKAWRITGCKVVASKDRMA